MKKDDTNDKIILEEQKNRIFELREKLKTAEEKLDEYLKKEEAISGALLDAQALAEKIINDAKAEAERIISDAEQKRNEILKMGAWTDNLKSKCLDIISVIEKRTA